MSNIEESVIAVTWFVLAWIDVSFSFVTGAIVFYLIQIDRKQRVFNWKYFLILVVVAVLGGRYSYDFLPYIVDDEYAGAITPINFVLGLFSKILLDIILTKKFVEGKLND